MKSLHPFDPKNLEMDIGQLKKHRRILMDETKSCGPGLQSQKLDFPNC